MIYEIISLIESVWIECYSICFIVVDFVSKLRQLITPAP